VRHASYTCTPIPQRHHCRCPCLLYAMGGNLSTPIKPVRSTYVPISVPHVVVSSHYLHFSCEKQGLRSPTQITVRCATTDGAPTLRAAILAYDKASNANYISRRLVTKVLHEDIQPFDRDATMCIRTQLNSEEVEGYVSLDWCSEHDRKQWHNTRFLVTTTYDAPYDAVLGKTDAERYDMIKRKNRR
jgi:hypothetical protein